MVVVIAGERLTTVRAPAAVDSATSSVESPRHPRTIHTIDSTNHTEAQGFQERSRSILLWTNGRESCRDGIGAYSTTSPHPSDGRSPMALLKSFRRLFSSNAPVEMTIDRSGETAIGELAPGPVADVTPAIDPAATIERLEATLTTGREVQDQTLEALKRVPQAVIELERMAGGQTELAEAIRSLEASGERRMEAESAVLQRLADLIEGESALFGLVQTQLDANQQAVEKTAARLEEITSAIHETARTNRTTGDAMEAMVAEIREREQRAEDRAGALQGWVVTCVVACLAATAASLALAWAVLDSSN